MTDDEIILHLDRLGYVVLTKAAFDQLREARLEHVAQAQALIAAKEADGTPASILPLPHVTIVNDLEGLLEDVEEALAAVIADMDNVRGIILQSAVGVLKRLLTEVVKAQRRV